MKTILFLTLFCINSFAIEISKQKTFTSSLLPTQQTSSFNLSYSSKSSAQIEKLFEKTISTVDKSSICKGGQYKIYPKYEYIQNKKIAKGYNSNIYFNCEFDDIKTYEKLIRKIKRNHFQLTQNKISYKVSEEQIEEEKLHLELQGYNYAKKYAKQLNKTFHNCTIKSVSFSSPHQPALYRASFKEHQATTTSPIKEKIQIKLTAQYLFDCQSER